MLTTQQVQSNAFLFRSSQHERKSLVVSGTSLYTETILASGNSMSYLVLAPESRGIHLSGGGLSVRRTEYHGRFPTTLCAEFNRKASELEIMWPRVILLLGNQKHAGTSGLFRLVTEDTIVDSLQIFLHNVLTLPLWVTTLIHGARAHLRSPSRGMFRKSSEHNKPNLLRRFDTK